MYEVNRDRYTYISVKKYRKREIQKKTRFKIHTKYVENFFLRL